MKNFFKNNWKYFITLIIGFVIGILMNFKDQTEYQVQYIKINNKQTVTKERIIEKTKTINVIDTLIKVDSIYLEKDGTFVQLPMEYKVYKDTLKTDSTNVGITINYSGINPSINSYDLDFTYNEKHVTEIQKARKFGIDISFGLYLGYGIQGSISNPIMLNRGPEIGIGFCIGPSYRITK